MCTLQFIYTVYLHRISTTQQRSFVRSQTPRYSHLHSGMLFGSCSFCIFVISIALLLLRCHMWSMVKKMRRCDEPFADCTMNSVHTNLWKKNNNNNKSLMLEFKAITFYWENLCECVLVRFNLKLLCTLIVVLLSALFQVKHCF